MNETLTYLIQPFLYPFMRDALVVAVLVAAPMALLSPFLVLKGWALMGDAVSHAVLPGIVVAYVLGLPLGIGAFAAGMLCATATGYLRENSRVKEDTVMGVVFSGMFGLGIVLYVAVPTDLHLDHILFGDILGVIPQDLVEAAVIGISTFAILLAKRRDLLVHAFDPTHAKAIGLPVRVLHYGLLALLSLAIVGALKAVGIILSVALLIMPGSIAFLIARRFEPMLAISVAVGVLSAFAGVYLSFYINSAPAPTIVVIMTLVFIVTFAVRTRTAARTA